MKLTKEQTQEIRDLQSQKNETKRVKVLIEDVTLNPQFNLITPPNTSALTIQYHPYKKCQHFLLSLVNHTI